MMNNTKPMSDTKTTPLTITIQNLYLGGPCPCLARKLDALVEATTTILKRLHIMSEQFNEAVAALESEISETRVEVGRLSGVIADLVAQIHAANEAGDTAAVRTATAELDAVNAQLQAIAPAAPVDPADLGV
jgi:hypothetical protein